VTFTVLAPEYVAECRRRAAAGEPAPGSALPADAGEDPGWFGNGPDNGGRLGSGL
jgi:hypothetical protein